MSPYEFRQGPPKKPTKSLPVTTGELAVGAGRAGIEVAKFFAKENPVVKSLVLGKKLLDYGSTAYDYGSTAYEFAKSNFAPELVSAASQLSGLLSNEVGAYVTEPCVAHFCLDRSVPDIRNFTKGLVYEMIKHRRERILKPDAEKETHLKQEMTTEEKTDFAELNHTAVMAEIVYMEKHHEVQWMLSKTSYDLIYATLDGKENITIQLPDSKDEVKKEIGKPNFALLANRTAKKAIVAIRGTKNLKDVIVDLNVSPAFLGTAPNGTETGTTIWGNCHSGMLHQATWMAEHAGVAQWIDKLYKNGYEIQITGHSLVRITIVFFFEQQLTRICNLRLSLSLSLSLCLSFTHTHTRTHSHFILHPSSFLFVDYFHRVEAQQHCSACCSKINFQTCT